jgi:hypothetical protein
MCGEHGEAARRAAPRTGAVNSSGCIRNVFSSGTDSVTSFLTARNTGLSGPIYYVVCCLAAGDSLLHRQVSEVRRRQGRVVTSFCFVRSFGFQPNMIMAFARSHVSSARTADFGRNSRRVRRRKRSPHLKSRNPSSITDSSNSTAPDYPDYCLCLLGHGSHKAGISIFDNSGRKHLYFSLKPFKVRASGTGKRGRFERLWSFGDILRRYKAPDGV